MGDSLSLWAAVYRSVDRVAIQVNGRLPCLAGGWKGYWQATSCKRNAMLMCQHAKRQQSPLYGFVGSADELAEGTMPLGYGHAIVACELVET